MVEFMDLRLASCTPDEFVSALLGPAPPGTVAYLNAHTTNLSRRDPVFRGMLGRMELLYPDGMGVVRAARWLGSPVPARVNAADFWWRFLWGCADRGLRVALVGGTPEVVDACAAEARRLVAGLELVFAHHGHFERGGPEEDRLLSSLGEARPDIVLVGMGSPRQERWALEQGARTGARTVWCVGALFELFGGLRPRAPLWMRASGLEWAFRLALEPRRLARRYLVGNPEFLLRVAARRMGGRR
jgi:N-acetylglucosaminyldiphosphoundecaprenol N-acetyl-beta-D-mannosaminyltransferase